MIEQISEQALIDSPTGLDRQQRAVTSALGDTRFAGVPPGRIIVRVKTPTATSEQRGVAVSNQELELSLRMP